MKEFFSYFGYIFKINSSNTKSALNKSVDIVDKYVVMSKTDLNGVIMSVSSAFCKISGYGYELIGKTHKCYKRLSSNTKSL